MTETDQPASLPRPASCGARICTADAQLGPHHHGDGVVSPTPHVPTYPTCDASCTTDCGHCKGNHEQARLGQIRARAEAASPGPWFGSGGGRVVYGRTPGDEVGVFQLVVDANLAQHAREDVPYLLGLLAEKDATIGRVRDLHQPVPYGSPETRAVAPRVPENVCSLCLEEHGGYVDHPYPTLRALDGREGR